MNDYSFGNRILELRESNHLSQAVLAKQLGVTAKAVSKWETGASKPKTDMIRKLAALFDVPIDDLLLLKEGVKKKRHY